MVIRRWRGRIFRFWKCVQPHAVHRYKPNHHTGIVAVIDLIVAADLFYGFIQRHSLCDDIRWRYLSAADFRAG